MPEAGQFLVDPKDPNVDNADVDETITMIDDIIDQSFQRIQRNRQSRIRVKMCRKAGKRADEVVILIFILIDLPLLIGIVKVLEEEMTTTEEDIDIVGVEKKEAAEEERRMKAAVAKVCCDEDYHIGSEALLRYLH